MLPEDLLSDDIVLCSLQKDKGKQAKLLSWTHENCTKTGENFFNVVKRLLVRYVDGGVESTTSYIAKLNPCKGEDMFNPYRQRAMVKEVFFYTELLPILNYHLEMLGQKHLNVPKHLHSSPEFEREVIILEDLKLKGFKPISRGTGTDENHSRVMAKEISKLHAASFALQSSLGSENLIEKFPLLIESWIVGDPKLRNAFEGVFIKGITHNLNLVKALEEYKDMIPWLENMTNKGMDTLVKELEYTDKWKGICHGDYHRSNVLFRYDESNVPQEVMIVDWQTVRVTHPASEIDYLLYSSYQGPSRELNFHTITETYFETCRQILGSKIHFSQSDFKIEVKNNNFGLLICFFLIPLSLCVNDPSELFKLEKGGVKKVPEEEALKVAREFLKTREHLPNVLADYLKEISASKLLK